MKKFVVLSLALLLVLSGCGETSSVDVAAGPLATQTESGGNVATGDPLSTKKDPEPTQSSGQGDTGTAEPSETPPLDLSVSGPNLDCEFCTLTYTGRAKSVLAAIEDPKGNTLYSPLSLEMALGLISEGAEGETRAQLLKYLGVEDGYGEGAKEYMEHAADLTDLEPLKEWDFRRALEIANSVWVRDEYTLTDEFEAVAKDSYSAEAASVDMSDPAGTSERVNAWCKEKTHDMIPSIITPNSITSDLAMILCNSVYFEAPWSEEWDVRAGEFTNADGTKVQLDEMLYDTVDTYYETDNAVGFGKYYLNGIEFVGILPDEGVTIDQIVLTKFLESMSRDYDVQCSMPKLDYEYTNIHLPTLLQYWGMTDAFDPDKAEFTGLVNESKDIFISDIIQRCKIELDENGTKAAAVTAILAKDNCVAIEDQPKIKEVHLNRPFYFMILDKQYKQVLFIGHVNFAS